MPTLEVGPKKYLPERNRSGEASKIPCRTGQFTDEKKRGGREEGEVVPRQCFAPGGGVLFFVFGVPGPATPPHAPSSHSPLARGPFPTLGPLGSRRLRPGRSLRPALTSPARAGKAATSQHPGTWPKLWGLRYAERRASEAGFSPQPWSREPWGWGPGLKRAPYASEPRRAGVRTARGRGKLATPGLAPSVAPGNREQRFGARRAGAGPASSAHPGRGRAGGSAGSANGRRARAPSPAPGGVCAGPPLGRS